MSSRNKIILALFASIVSTIVVARETTLDEAKAVVTGWSRGNGRGFGSTGAVTGGWSVKDSTGTVLYHMITTRSGAVAVAADTDIEPIVAYLPGSNGKLPEGHPMKAMLERDMSSRISIFRTVPNTTSSVLKLSTSSLSTSSVSRGEALEASAEKSNTKWTKLTSDSKRLVLTTSALDPEGNPPTIISWLDEWNINGVGPRAGQLRVWNQSNSSHFATNGQIFNRYTPQNYVCGCVATAGASVLHYWETPKGEVVSKTCYVGNERTVLTTSGIEYDWSILNDTLKWDVPKTLTAKQVEVLGRAASDMGIAVGMMYASGASSAFVTDISTAMRNVFGFGSARATAQIREGYDKSVFEPLIYNQVRAGMPVVMGIFGDVGGHAVVACGYGEDDGAPYTYVFTGWGGEGDAWYALPNIETKSTWGGELYAFDVIAELTTMAAPDANGVAVVGKVVDPTGFLIDDDEVSFTMPDGSYLEATNGYFGARVPAIPGTYEMTCDNSGEVYTYTIKNDAGTPLRYPQRGEDAYTLANALPPAMTLTISSGILKTYTDWTAAQREAIRSGRPIVALQGAKGSSIVRQVRNTLRRVYENDEVASSNFIESVVFYYHNKRQNGFGVVDPRKFDGTTFGEGPAFFNYDTLTDADPAKWRDMLTNGVENVWYSTERALTNIVVTKRGDELLLDVSSDITNRSFVASLMFEDAFTMSNANLVVDWAVTNTGYGIAIDNNGIVTIGYAAKGTNTVVAAGEFKGNLETEYKHIEGATNIIVAAFMNFSDDDECGRANADYITRNSGKNPGYGEKIYSAKVSTTESTYRRVEKPHTAIFYCTGVRATDVTTGEELTNAVITTGKDKINNKEILSIKVPKGNKYRVEWQWKTISYYLDVSSHNCIVDTSSGWVEPDVTKTITATLPSEYDIAIWQGQGIPTTTNLACEVLVDAPKSVKVFGFKREALPKPENAVEELLPAPSGYLAKAYYDNKGNFIGTSWEIDPQVQNSANAGALAIENNTVNLKIPNAIAGFTYKLLRCDLGSNKTTEEQAIKATKDGPITLSAPCSGSSGFYKILVIP